MGGVRERGGEDKGGNPVQGAEKRGDDPEEAGERKFSTLGGLDLSIRRHVECPSKRSVIVLVSSYVHTILGKSLLAAAGLPILANSPGTGCVLCTSTQMAGKRRVGGKGCCIVVRVVSTAAVTRKEVSHEPKKLPGVFLLWESMPWCACGRTGMEEGGKRE